MLSAACESIFGKEAAAAATEAEAEAVEVLKGILLHLARWAAVS